jgi:hypothetical protein
MLADVDGAAYGEPGGHRRRHDAAVDIVGVDRYVAAVRSLAR